MANITPPDGRTRMIVEEIFTRAPSDEVAEDSLLHTGIPAETYQPILEEVKERVSIETEPALPEPSYIVPAAQFLSVTDPPADDIVCELLAKGSLGLLHGEPRTRKTWAALEIAAAVSTGTPAFGLKRFGTTRSRVLYSSQEDGAPLVRQRMNAILAGRGVDCDCPGADPDYPGTDLNFAIHAGIDLDSAQWQKNLLADIASLNFGLVVLDPIRRYSTTVDKGPAEVRAITAFLRKIIVETGATVLIVHHDVKPPVNGQDVRRRGHRASGGDWFAAAECPISLEAAGESQTVVYPEAYKLSSDPEPFTFSVETDDPRRPTTARVVGETTTASDAATIALDEAVLGYLADRPGASGTAVSKGIRKQKSEVLDSLNRLFAADKVDRADGPRRAQLWTVRSSSEPLKHGNHSK